MLRCIRKEPKLTFEERRVFCDTKISNSYIKRLYKKHNIAHWRTKKRPELTKKHTYLYLLWARTRAHWDVVRWRRMMFSDKCSAERGAGKKQIWCFSELKDKWKSNMVETYKSNKNMKIMIWGMFWGSWTVLSLHNGP